MDINKNLVLTDAAIARLEQAVSEYKTAVEEALAEYRYTPGEDNIEITASDLEEVLSGMRVVNRRRSVARDLVLRIYLAIGVVLTTVGVLYGRLSAFFSEAFSRHPEQLFILLSGVVFLSAGVVGRLLIERRHLQERTRR